MNAKEILAFYADRAPWLTPGTVDRIIYGDAEKPVKKLLVTWQASIEAICYAGERNFDTIMTHEPTFYFHADEWQNVQALPDGSNKKKTALVKAALLDKHSITVLRNHDVWDAMPDIGITWKWAEHLALGEPAARSANGFQLAFDIPETTLATLAQRVGQSLCDLGDDSLIYYGDPMRSIKRLGIGTGCITRVEDYLAMECDAALFCDDGTSYWQDVSLGLDAGMSILRVSHGGSEEPGVRALAIDAQKHFPKLTVEHYALNLRGRRA